MANLMTWLLALAATLAGSVCWSLDVESSMSMADYPSSGFRMMGITKTMATTTTVVTTQTVYVHPMCYSVVANVKPCSMTPPTTTPAPVTTPTPTTPTTPTTTTTNKPWIQIIAGSPQPVLTGTFTFNKVPPPRLELNLPSISNGNANQANGSSSAGNNPTAGNGGLINLFNKPAINLNVGGSVSASVSSGNGRRRRSQLVEENNIQPSLVVRSMEMTASPVAAPIQPEVVAVEASLAENNDDISEYELVGLTADHFNTDRAMNIFNKKLLTIIKLDKVTVTSSTVATVVYPVVNPSDRVTIAYYGCIPKDAPTTLPSC